MGLDFSGFVWKNELVAITLYKRQKQVLEYLRQYIQKNGYSPTLAQIAEAINVSSLATVHEHLAVMAKKGLIRKYNGVNRGIELVGQSIKDFKDSTSLPILGFIAAGSPIEPYTDPNASMPVSSILLSGKKSAFVLQVKGESMVEDGIRDGDYVVIENQEEVKNGDIVVALLENGFATLKRYFKETNRIRLEPANSSMTPIYATNVKIQGRVVGLLRRYA